VPVGTRVRRARVEEKKQERLVTLRPWLVTTTMPTRRSNKNTANINKSTQADQDRYEGTYRLIQVKQALEHHLLRHLNSLATRESNLTTPSAPSSTTKKVTIPDSSTRGTTRSPNHSTCTSAPTGSIKTVAAWSTSMQTAWRRAAVLR
jgi:hypothetical protein